MLLYQIAKRADVRIIYSEKDIERNFKNHFGAISFSTHLMSTCIVISCVIIRDVKLNTIGPTLSGEENNKNELDESAMAAGTNA